MRFSSKKSSKGLSIIELVIVMAISSIMTLGMMKMFDFQTKANKHIAVGTAVNEFFRAFVERIKVNTDNICTTSFQGQNLPKAVAINGRLRNATNVVLYETVAANQNATYEMGQIQIAEIYISADPEIQGGYRLYTALTKKGDQLGGKTIIRSTPVFLTLLANNVTINTCSLTPAVTTQNTNQGQTLATFNFNQLSYGAAGSPAPTSILNAFNLTGDPELGELTNLGWNGILADIKTWDFPLNQPGAVQVSVSGYCMVRSRSGGRPTAIYVEFMNAGTMIVGFLICGAEAVGDQGDFATGSSSNTFLYNIPVGANIIRARSLQPDNSGGISSMTTRGVIKVLN